MKHFSLLLLFCATACTTAAWAQDPPYIYQDIGFTPKDFRNALTVKQKADLDACLASAKEQVDRRTKANYPSFGDLFGVTLCDCLADEENGKGWNVREKTGNGWKETTVLKVTRKFMGLD